MNSPIPYSISSLGDSAVTIDYGNIIDENINLRVHSIRDWLNHRPFEGLIDIVIGYSSLSVIFDPWLVYQHQKPTGTIFSWIEQLLTDADKALDAELPEKNRVVEIPVCYDQEYAPDLLRMSYEKKIGVQEIIQTHFSRTYRVYMIGFLPGFAYLGQIEERLTSPRKEKPSPVLAGSVGIAGKQTGIYPLNSPGGWNIIGRTPLKLFNIENDPPVILQSGDDVKFYPIDLRTFNELNRNF